MHDFSDKLNYPQFVGCPNCVDTGNNFRVLNTLRL